MISSWTPERKAAHSQKMREWHAAHPEHWKSYTEEVRSWLRVKASKAPYRHYWVYLRSDARTRGLEFSLTLDDLKELILGPASEEYQGQSVCYYCHAELEWFPNEASWFKGRKYRSNIDRKDNSKGYIAENVVPCCWRCNRGKGSDFTYEEWYDMTTCFRSKPVLPRLDWTLVQHTPRPPEN